MNVGDLPLEELKKYSGSSPCPKDFDDYWAEALKELDGQSNSVELIPAAFQHPDVECFDLYFTGVGGLVSTPSIYALKKVAAPHPALLEFHGYTWHSGEWFDKIPFATLGYSVLSMDCRGQGGLSEDNFPAGSYTHNGHIVRGIRKGAKSLLYRSLFLDTVQLARIAMELPEVDPQKIGAKGGSQGGALTVACAALEPRIALLAPIYPFLADYRRVWEMGLAEEAYGEIREYFVRFDPLHREEAWFFETLGYIDIQNLAKRIEGKVLFTTALSDSICPPSTQFAVYNKIESEKEMLIYPDFGHDDLSGIRDITYNFFRENWDR